SPEGDEIGTMSLPLPDADGYGPLGTPNRGRDERIARAERERAASHYRAAMRMERDPDPIDSAELRSLRAETRQLRDWLRDLRREIAQVRGQIPAQIESEIERILADQLPEIIDYQLARREASRNGQAHRR